MNGNDLKLSLIKDYMKKNNFTAEQFCEKSKIAKTDFNKLMVLDYDFSINVLIKLAMILNVELYELFE